MHGRVCVCTGVRVPSREKGPGIHPDYLGAVHVQTSPEPIKSFRKFVQCPGRVYACKINASVQDHDLCKIMPVCVYASKKKRIWRKVGFVASGSFGP